MSLIIEDFGQVIGGGKMEETVLWTNLAPSSEWSSGNVTLSDDMNNYDFLKFVFKRATTDENLTDVIYPVSTFKNLVVGNNKFKGAIAFYSSSSTSYSYARSFYYVSDTVVTISSMAQINGAQTNSAHGIPLKIIGMKLVKGTNTAGVQIGDFIAAQGDNTINLNFKPSKLFIYKDNIMTSSSSGTPNGMFCIVYDEDLNTSKQFGAYCLTGGWYGNARDYPYTETTFAGLKEITSSKFVIHFGTTYSALLGLYHFVAVK